MPLAVEVTFSFRPVVTDLGHLRKLLSEMRSEGRLAASYDVEDAIIEIAAMRSMLGLPASGRRAGEVGPCR